MNHGSLFRVVYIKEDKRPICPLASIEQNKRNEFEDYEINEFTKELVNFKFQCYKYFHIAREGRQGNIEYSILLEHDSDTRQYNEKGKGEIIITILIIL